MQLSANNQYLRIAFFSLIDIYRENLGYHSASLTYQFLTVVGSVIMLLGFSSLYLPFLEPVKVYGYLKDIVPTYADTVLNKLLPFYKNKAVGSVLSLVLAYYFSVSFSKTMNDAFGYVYRKKPVEGEVYFWTVMPFLLFVYTAVVSLTATFLAISKSFLGSFYQRITELMSLFSLFLMIGMLYSAYFRLRKSVLLTSALVALSLLALNKVFSIVLAKLITTSPLYSVMGTPLLFLVWLYYSFMCLLVGVCFLRRIEDELYKERVI